MIYRKAMLQTTSLAALLALAMTAAFAAPAVKIALPLGRAAYQTNDTIDLTVWRNDTAPLAAGRLVLTVAGMNGDKIVYSFPVAAAPSGTAVEQIALDARALRPGAYTLTVDCDHATTQQQIAVYNQVRKSSFRIVNWGGAPSGVSEGEDGFGYNLALSGPHNAETFLSNKLDYMQLCTMSGGHQMDLRSECDWSDPYVTRGGTERAAGAMQSYRSFGNAVGVHYYDEPGLTWLPDPETGQSSPFVIPSQHEDYISAFGYDYPDADKLDPSNPHDVDAWHQYATWKLGFMDSAWKDAKFGVDSVDPNSINCTQSQYGWTAFTDGYYFNVVRDMDVVSGHGGYDDLGGGVLSPIYFLEGAKARDWSQPNWYLPTWYGSTPFDRYRTEQYGSFINGLQGMSTPPGLDPTSAFSNVTSDAIIESNHRMLRIGTIFTNREPTMQPVGLLFSMSDLIHEQTLDRSIRYAHETRMYSTLQLAWTATKEDQIPAVMVTDEDIEDGTCAANQKALILCSVKYLAPHVVAGIESFIQHGGTVYMVGHNEIKIDGAIDLGMDPQLPDAATIAANNAAKNWQANSKLIYAGSYDLGARDLALALKPLLAKIGVEPVFQCDAPGILAAHQASGDIDYYLAVNATPVADRTVSDIAPVVANIAFNDGKAGNVYDVDVSRDASDEFPAAGAGKFSFGPGELKVWARTARPIGGVRAGAVATGDERPSLSVNALLVDTDGGVISGAAPMEVRVDNSLGEMRYDLYRATENGVLSLTLPLGDNDAAGAWKVKVTELLSGKSATTSFDFKPAKNVTATASLASGAAIFHEDQANIDRFLRDQHNVTIVAGSSDFDSTAAFKLAAALDAHGIHSTTVRAAGIGPRPLTADQAKTWCGLDYTGSGTIKPGNGNDPRFVGFDIQGPVVLIGNPTDNPLIKFLSDNFFLPYTLSPSTFPGPGQGYLGWEDNAIGVLQQSVSLIGFDEAGIDQAEETLAEAAAGKWPAGVAPTEAAATTATSTRWIPEPKTLWTVALSDRATSIASSGNGVTVTTADGMQTVISASGTAGQQTSANPGDPHDATAPTVPPALAKARPDRVAKYVATNAAGLTAIGYWGGTVNVFDATGAAKMQEQLPEDVTGLVWVGDNLIVGSTDGRIMGQSLP